MKERNNKKKAGIVRTAVKVGAVIGIIVSLIWASGGPYPQLIVNEKSWHVIWKGNIAQATEASLSGNSSGILEIYFVNHTVSAVTENTTATIEGWCTAAGLGYANADDFNTELAHSTLFDVVVRVRGNKTVCWNTDKFYNTDLKVEWTSADLSIGADTAMTGTVSRNNTAEWYLWMNFRDDNGGAGFSLAKGASADITSIKFSAYY